MAHEEGRRSGDGRGGARRRDANCPNKRTMMVKGEIVLRDHSAQSSRSNSPTPSKTHSEDDLLVVRQMLRTIQFKNLLMKPKEKIVFTPATLSRTSYVP